MTARPTDIPENGVRTIWCIDDATMPCCFHDMEKCTAEYVRCHHGWGRHFVVSRECAKQEREQMLLTIQDEEKVHVMRARQILERNNEYVELPQQKFPTHFDCEVTEESKRKKSVWKRY